MRRVPYYGVYHAELDPALAATMGNVCVTARWLDPGPLVAAGLQPVFQVEQPTEALLRDPESAATWPSIVSSVERWQEAGVRPAAIWLGDELWANLYGGWFHNHPDWPSLRGVGLTEGVRDEFTAGLDRYARALKRICPGVPLGSVDNWWGVARPVPDAWDFAALDVYHSGPWPVGRDVAEAVLSRRYGEARRFGRPLVGVGQAFAADVEGWQWLPSPEMLELQADLITAHPAVVGLIWYGLKFTQGGKRGIADDPALIAVAQRIYHSVGD